MTSTRKPNQLERLEKCRKRVSDMERNLYRVSQMLPQIAYMVPMVESFDFQNFETKLAEVIDDHANDNK